MKPIPYGRHHITDEDINRVVEVLRSDYLTQGPTVAEFERAFAGYVGAKHAVAVANGTAALHLCALALGIGPQSRVITTPITFAASANCVAYAGGRIEFADIDPHTYLLDYKAVETLLQGAPAGTYAGIIGVDFGGRALDLEAFRTLANRHDCWLLEDACHAPGAFFRDSDNREQRCGNGNFADLSVFSFHPVKHIATGEGGMITTNNHDLYNRLLLYRSHGITKNPDEFIATPQEAVAEKIDNFPNVGEEHPGWYYEMQALGFNYRISDIQAALGLSQLQRAEWGLSRRREIAGIYSQAFSEKPFVLGQSGTVDGHAYHLYVLEVEDRLGLYKHLRQKGIQTQVHYIPLHMMPYYQRLGWRTGCMPHAELYYGRCLSIPIYPTLTQEQQMYVISSIEEYYG